MIDDNKNFKQKILYQTYWILFYKTGVIVSLRKVKKIKYVTLQSLCNSLVIILKYLKIYKSI